MLEGVPEMAESLVSVCSPSLVLPQLTVDVALEAESFVLTEMPVLAFLLE